MVIIILYNGNSFTVKRAFHIEMVPWVPFWYIGICIWFKQHFDTRYLVFYNPSPPRMFLSLDLLSEYRIQHGAIERMTFMSHLATQLGYSAGEFQALQLIVLATFGVVN